MRIYGEPMPIAELSLHIIVDDTDEQILRRVLESLDKIDGITARSFTKGTNSINASAEWEESEISRKIEEIQNIENVTTLNYNKRVKRSILEPSVKVSDVISYTIIKDPIGEINRAQSEQDYFKAISYSCTVFEYYGKQILVWYFKKNNTPVSKDRLERFSLESTIIMLYTHKIIDDNIKTKILEVTGLRNRFIHEDYAIRLSSEQIKEAKRITLVALQSLNFLKTIYDNMVEAR